MPIITFDQVTSARVKRLDAYWRSKISGGRLPARSDIDPSELRDLLPFLIIAEIEQDPFRVRYRLSGTMIQQLDEELSGRYLDELVNTSEDDKAMIAAAYKGVVETAQPYYSIREFPSRLTGHPLTVQVGIWPLRGHSDRIEQCVAIMDYVNL